MSNNKKIPINRRDFLKSATAASAVTAFQIIPAYAAPRSKESRKNDRLPPSETLALAVIGCGGRGAHIGSWAMRSPMTHTVALCDVVPSRAGKLAKKSTDAELFDDFRKMFDKLGDKIDVCTVGVPDHSHFPIAMRAMSQNAAVYVEKPLAHTFQEVELMMAAEKKYKVACQMGNQGHSGNNYVQFKSWVDAGIITHVRRVDAYMNRARRWHPWGEVTAFPTGTTMPDGMNWDVWAGTAPVHPYSEKYDTKNWRGWYDYGCGVFGDWGAHILDTIHQFLELGLPHTIRVDNLKGKNDFIYPLGSAIAFEFAERRKDMPAMTVNWYDGVDDLPPRPKELENGRKIETAGKIIHSDDLVFKGGTHNGTLRIVPEKKMKEMTPKLPRLHEKQTDHMTNLLLAAKGEETCRSSFDVAGPLTQVLLLGCIAQRLGGTFKFDAKTKQFIGNERANQLLMGHPPRKGWEEYYKL